MWITVLIIFIIHLCCLIRVTRISCHIYVIDICLFINLIYFRLPCMIQLVLCNKTIIIIIYLYFFIIFWTQKSYYRLIISLPIHLLFFLLFSLFSINFIDFLPKFDFLVLVNLFLPKSFIFFSHFSFINLFF